MNPPLDAPASQPEPLAPKSFRFWRSLGESLALAAGLTLLLVFIVNRFGNPDALTWVRVGLFFNTVMLLRMAYRVLTQPKVYAGGRSVSNVFWGGLIIYALVWPFSWSAWVAIAILPVMVIAYLRDNRAFRRSILGDPPPAVDAADPGHPHGTPPDYDTGDGFQRRRYDL